MARFIILSLLGGIILSRLIFLTGTVVHRCVKAVFMCRNENKF